MRSGLVGPGGEPLGANPPAPAEELRESPMGPKESAEIKEAAEEQRTLDAAFGNVGRILIQNIAAGLEILHRLGENEERRFKAQDRAIKSAGVHRDLFRGIQMERGMVVWAKPKKEDASGDRA